MSGSLIGYGQNDKNRLGRVYPSWMQSLGDRGLGVANTNPVPAVPFIDIPRGGETPGYNVQPSYGYVAPQYAMPNGEPGAAGAGDRSQADYSGPMSNATGSLYGDFKGLVGGLYDGISQGIGDIFGGGGNGDMGGAPAGGPAQGGTGEVAANTAEAAQTGGQFGMYRGGIVTRNKLTGPDPRGPDDGYAPLDVGEGVLTAKAIKHYGLGLVAKLNKLQISKDALR